MESGAKSDTADLEAFDALQGTLRDVFFDPVEEELDDMQQTVVKHIRSADREQSNRLRNIKSDLDKKLGQIGTSYEGLDESLQGLTASMERARHLLADEEGQSEIRNLAQRLQRAQEALQSSMQALKDTQAERHKTLVGQHKELQSIQDESLDAIKSVQSALPKKTNELALRLEGKLSGIATTCSELDAVLTGVADSTGAVLDVLTDGDGRSELRRLSEMVVGTQESIESVLQALKETEATYKEAQAQRHAKTRKGIENNLDAIHEMGATLTQKMDALSSRVKAVERQQRWMLWGMAVATVLILWTIGMSTWLAISSG